MWPDGKRESLLRLARARVVSRQQFVARDLVRPDSSYGRFATLKAVLARLFPPREYLVVKYGRPTGKFGTARLYKRRLREGIKLIRLGAARPGRIRDDIALDRLIHSLQQPTPASSAVKMLDRIGRRAVN
jgi:hypothetical protein